MHKNHVLSETLFFVFLRFHLGGTLPRAVLGDTPSPAESGIGRRESRSQNNLSAFSTKDEINVPMALSVFRDGIFHMPLSLKQVPSPGLRTSVKCYSCVSVCYGGTLDGSGVATESVLLKNKKRKEKEKRKKEFENPPA